MKTYTHEILALDVWGNAQDGWEINNMLTTGVFVDLTDEMSDVDIIKVIRKACGHRADARGYVIQDASESLQYSGVCIDVKRDGKPAYYTRPA